MCFPGDGSLAFKLVFLRNSWVIWNQSYYESYRRMGMKIYINELGLMIKMAAMPIYGKKSLKIFFSRTIGLMALKQGM